MSRIGKKPIIVPLDVNLDIKNDKIIVKGKNGSLEQKYDQRLKLNLEKNELIIIRTDEYKTTKAYHGLLRSLIQNMITGVKESFTKVLIAEGIGYKFQVEKTKIILSVGFSHPVEFELPQDIIVKSESPTKILIKGTNKEKVGLFASQIRAIKPPEPYKGKGIMYENEKIIRKVGKTGK